MSSKNLDLSELYRLLQALEFVQGKVNELCKQNRRIKMAVENAKRPVVYMYAERRIQTNDMKVEANSQKRDGQLQKLKPMLSKLENVKVKKGNSYAGTCQFEKRHDPARTQVVKLPESITRNGIASLNSGSGPKGVTGNGYRCKISNQNSAKSPNASPKSKQKSNEQNLKELKNYNAAVKSNTEDKLMLNHLLSLLHGTKAKTERKFLDDLLTRKMREQKIAVEEEKGDYFRLDSSCSNKSRIKLSRENPKPAKPSIFQGNVVNVKSSDLCVLPSKPRNIRRTIFPKVDKVAQAKIHSASFPTTSEDIYQRYGYKANPQSNREDTRARLKLPKVFDDQLCPREMDGMKVCESDTSNRDNTAVAEQFSFYTLHHSAPQFSLNRENTQHAAKNGKSNTLKSKQSNGKKVSVVKSHPSRALGAQLKAHDHMRTPLRGFTPLSHGRSITPVNCEYSGYTHEDSYQWD